MSRATRRTGIVFRDMLFCIACLFLVVIVLMIVHIHPPTEGEDSAKPAGNLIVEARWPDEVDCDIDLWVRAPKERPVGFSNQHSATFDLLRDDLGQGRDDTGLNYEFAYSRGAPAGEYVINIHWYSNVIGAESVAVIVVVSIAASADAKPVKLYSGSVTLMHVGHEATVIRFTLDADGKVVPGSVHDTPVALKGARQ